MKNLLTITLFTVLITSSASAGTRDNDDTCDIKVGPAATLLLPYFEVELQNPSGRTTLFAITNVSRYPQIARVTLWTDWSYPVFTFNVFLTGYDVQSINLRDILVGGIIAPPAGTSSTTTPGSLSAPNGGNGNLDLSIAPCTNLPGSISKTITTAMATVFTTGVLTGGLAACPTGVGGVHADAIGYATIDVVANCGTTMPSDPLYYTNDLLFDNVLIGDYQQLGPQPAGTSAPASFDAAGNPMVHIRAVPEGGGAGGGLVATGLPYTFYDRYTPAANRTADRRQPLPSTFAARFIQGGTTAFATNLTIWRETYGGVSCADVRDVSVMPAAEIVRFDEHGNASTYPPCTTLCGPHYIDMPATSSTASSSENYPFMPGNDVGGWLYLDLNNGGSTRYSVTTDVGGAPGPTNRRTNLSPAGGTTSIGPRPSQNWVTVTMFGSLGPNRLSTEFDAASLGNGCSPAAALSDSNRPIGPAGGVFVCPPGKTQTNGSTVQCTGTNVNPVP
jgi:hypothetical protein